MNALIFFFFELLKCSFLLTKLKKKRVNIAKVIIEINPNLMRVADDTGSWLYRRRRTLGLGPSMNECPFIQCPITR
jgi:hypothetical protein